MEKKRKRNRDLEEKLKQHCNVRDKFNADLENGESLAQCIHKAQQAIDNFYSPARFAACKEDFDPDLLIAKYNKLHFENSKRKETYRSLLTGFVSGLCTSLVFSVNGFAGKIHTLFYDAKGHMTMSEAISTFGISQMIAMVFCIAAFLGLTWFTKRDLKQRDSDPYHNFVVSYEEEAIKEMLVGYYGIEVL